MSLRPLLHWVAYNLLANPRVIFDREGESPYLSRFYLRGRPRMLDGSEPFDESGAPKKAAIFPDGVAVYLHRFHRSDSDGALHNHPWKWARSLVLAGGYIEERRAKDWRSPPWHSVERRVIRPFSWNKIDATDFHRVDLIESDCWSLFIAGPKTGESWGFWDRWTGKFLPWREFIAQIRGAGWDGGETVRS